MRTSGQSGGTLAAGGSVVSEGGSSVGAAREGCGSLRGCWGVTTIGFSGSGHIGSQLARLAVAQGHDVVMSNSRGPASVAALVAEFGPHAWAATPAEEADVAELDSEAEWTPPPVNGPPGLRYRDAPHDTERAVS